MNGLWTAEFGSNNGMFGSGVVILYEGRIMGGDSTHYYIGEYNLKDGTFNATLRIIPFIPGAQSVFGTIGLELIVDLVGSPTADGQITAQGHPRGLPQLRLGIKLTKRG
jgi:hypothetical protein